MFYAGMPDLYHYETDNHSYDAFWHDGEFYLHNRTWAKDNSEEFQYFDDVDNCLKAMLEIAPYYKWKRVDFD